MANIFQKLELEAFRAGITPRTKQSREWFMKKAKTLKSSRLQLMQDEPIQLRNRHGIGNMYMYFYDPKHKKTLPYYDRFPLSIIVEPAKGGFMGLNLHYLPNVLRAKFLDGLMDITNNKKYDETTKFRATLNLLKGSSSLKYFKPCLKHYLVSHVKSRFALVPAPEWEIAAFLPTADFEKQSQGSIYRDSRKML